MYWEVVFVYPGQSKGETLGSYYCFGVVAGSAAAAKYGERSGIQNSKKWWGLTDSCGIYEGASGYKGMIEGRHKSAKGRAYGSGERIGCLADLDARALRFYREGKELEGLVIALPAAAAGEALYPVVTPYNTGVTATLSTPPAPQ